MSAGLLKPRESNDAPAADRPVSRTASLAWLGVVALLFFALFGRGLLRLAEFWSNDPSYSHGFLVPIIGLWLAVRAYRRAGAPVEGDLRIGCMGTMAGCVVHLTTVIVAWPPLDFLAVGLVLWGLAVALGGVEWAKGFLFPIGFLFFMYPLPVVWTAYAALVLQDWVAHVSAGILDLFVVCYRRGNSLYLAGVSEPLVVAAECSGLRQIVAFLALGTLVAGLLNHKPMSFRVLLVAAAVPVAIVANVARILLMATGAVWFGTRWMGGWMHDAPAAVTLPLGLALFVLVGWLLSRCFRNPQSAIPNPTEPTALSTQHSALSTQHSALMSGAGCLCVGLLAQFGLFWHLRVAEVNPYPDLTAPFADLPRTLGDPAKKSPFVWRGQDVDKLDEFKAKLPYKADDLLYRVYFPKPAGAPLHLYMVYSRQGEDRKHHPEICIRDASGASEDLQARQRIVLDADGERAVMRFRFRTGASQFTTVYYWHYTLEAPPGQKQSFLQALHQRQSHVAPSLTVQVSLDAQPDELENVEKVFLVAVDSALRKGHLPSTARIGCHRLPIALTRD